MQPRQIIPEDKIQLVRRLRGFAPNGQKPEWDEREEDLYLQQ